MPRTQRRSWSLCLPALLALTSIPARADDPPKPVGADAGRDGIGARIPSFDQSLENSGRNHTAMENFALARGALDLCISIRTSKYGEKDGRVARAKWFRADVDRHAALAPEKRAALARAWSVKYQVKNRADAGRFREAIADALEDLKVTREILGDDHYDTAFSLNNLALVLHGLGQFEDALRETEQAVNIARQILGERHLDYISAFSNRAGWQMELGRYEIARPEFERALALYEEAEEKDPELHFSIVNNLADTLRRQGDYRGARRRFEQAKAIVERTRGKNDPDYALCLNNLAVTLERLAETPDRPEVFNDALKLCDEAVRLREARDPRGLDYAVSLANRAGLRLRRYFAGLRDNSGRPEDVRRWIDEARADREKVLAIQKEALGERHPDFANALNNLAMVLELQGDLDGARDRFEQAIAIETEVLGDRHPLTVLTTSNLATTLRLRGEPARAREMLERSLKTTREGTERELPTLSTRQLLSKIQATKSYLDDVLSLSLAMGGPAAQDYAPLLAWKGLTAEAAAARRAALADPKARDALAAVAEAKRRLATLCNPALKVPRDALEPLIRRATEEKERRETDLARLIPSRPSAPTVSQVAAALPKDAVFVDFVRYTRRAPRPERKDGWTIQDRYAAFLVRPDATVERVELGEAGAIGEAVHSWRDALMRKDPDLGELGQEVRALLWEPLTPRLSRAKTILIAPDGALNAVPWGALPDVGGDFLIRRYAFAIVGSGRQLVKLAGDRPAPARGGLLAVGGIDYDCVPAPAAPQGLGGPFAANPPVPRAANDRTFPTLFGSWDEVEAITAVHDARRRGEAMLTLTGLAATRPRLREEMPGRRYLHLATHGRFTESGSAPSDDPHGPRAWEGMSRDEAAGWFPELLCGLAFAGANRPPADGSLDEDAGAILTAEEISGLDLRGCELAVLSACGTGLGKSAGGEGVHSLQRAFQDAGCLVVVASLWKVDDGATRALMERFYEGLWGRGLPPLEALRAAQLDLLDRYMMNKGDAHPEFWSAWTLAGGPGA